MMFLFIWTGKYCRYPSRLWYPSICWWISKVFRPFPATIKSHHALRSNQKVKWCTVMQSVAPCRTIGFTIGFCNFVMRTNADIPIRTSEKPDELWTVAFFQVCPGLTIGVRSTWAMADFPIRCASFKEDEPHGLQPFCTDDVKPQASSAMPVFSLILWQRRILRCVDRRIVHHSAFPNKVGYCSQ